MTQARRRARAYLVSARWAGRLPALPGHLGRLGAWAGALHRALWLGVLDPTDLTALTRAHYMGPSGFERAEFNVEQGLWPWEAAAIDAHLAGCRRVLVAGAGGGREAIALARRGHEVTAFDFAPVLTAACRRHLQAAGVTAAVLEAPPGGAPAGLAPQDALLVGRGCYHHLPGRAARVAFLVACRAPLPAGAPVLLSDFFVREEHASFHRRTRRVAGWLRRLRGAPPVELGDWLGLTFQHAFTRPEVESELREAGIEPRAYALVPGPGPGPARLASLVGQVAPSGAAAP